MADITIFVPYMQKKKEFYREKLCKVCDNEKTAFLTSFVLMLLARVSEPP